MEIYVVCSRCWGCPPLLVFPGFPTQVHSTWFPVVKTASLCLRASGSCWSLLCCQNSRRNMRGMGLPGATSNKRPMGTGTGSPPRGVCPQLPHQGKSTIIHMTDTLDDTFYWLYALPCLTSPPLFVHKIYLHFNACFSCCFWENPNQDGAQAPFTCLSQVYKCKGVGLVWPLCLPHLDSSLQLNERGCDDPHLKRLWAWKSFVQSPKLRHR